MSKAAKQASEIDRLIELASEDKHGTGALTDARNPIHSEPADDSKEARPSMWRVLLQLRVLLPYLAKVLPLVERGLLGTNITGQALAGHALPADTSQIDRGIAGVSEAQRDVNNAVKAQTLEIKYLQDQIELLNMAVEKDLLLREEIATNLTSLKKLVQGWAVTIVVLLAVVIALALFAIFRSAGRVG
jgi:hypothetical protein